MHWKNRERVLALLPAKESCGRTDVDIHHEGARGASWCRMNVIKSSNGSNHMNVRHLVPSVSRRLLSMGSLILAASLHYASGEDLSKYKRIEPQFIAALGDPGATSGNGAQSWGFWNQDPGPRACMLDHYPQLKAT